MKTTRTTIQNEHKCCGAISNNIQYCTHCKQHCEKSEAKPAQKVGVTNIKIVVTEKIDFIQPYRVTLLPDLSLKSTPIISWTFSKLDSAIKVATDLSKRHEAKHYIFGDEIVEEASQIVNVI